MIRADYCAKGPGRSTALRVGGLSNNDYQSRTGFVTLGGQRLALAMERFLALKLPVR
uniref:Uncharacterized protein n=1 Tax=Hyaloperonospora arabidopsidis (strain Emoy2) TaxID=559515 RepID=M4BH22_HYAAE